jgi:hypothetical protein
MTATITIRESTILFFCGVSPATFELCGLMGFGHATVVTGTRVAVPQEAQNWDELFITFPQFLQYIE